jgi:hypothetical protein
MPKKQSVLPPGLTDLQVAAIKDLYHSCHDGLDAAELTYEDNHEIVKSIKLTIKNALKAFPWLKEEYR